MFQQWGISREKGHTSFRILISKKSHPCISHQPRGFAQSGHNSFFQGFVGVWAALCQCAACHALLFSVLPRPVCPRQLLRPGQTRFSLPAGKLLWFYFALVWVTKPSFSISPKAIFKSALVIKLSGPTHPTNSGKTLPPYILEVREPTFLIEKRSYSWISSYFSS